MTNDRIFIASSIHPQRQFFLSGLFLCISVLGLFSCKFERELIPCSQLRFSVAYTASLNGNLLGCDCHGFPEAGLDKRAWYLQHNPLSEDTILVDAGNIMEAGRDSVLASYILEIYEELGYHAMAVGIHELSEGLETLDARCSVNVDIPMLAHNLELEGYPLSTAPLIHRMPGGTTVAVVALADPDWFAPYLERYDGKLKLINPITILTDQRRIAAEEGADAVILLCHGSEAWIREMAATTPLYEKEAGTPVMVVILAGEEKFIESELSGGIPIFSPGEEGNNLGVVDIRLRHRFPPRWKNKTITFHYLGPGDNTVILRGLEYASYLDKKRSQ